VHLDHVVIAAADLSAAARELEARHGLLSVEGGRHPGWGTANRIVPLGDAYLELVAVADPAAAAASAFGAWVAAGVASGGGPLGWAVRTDRIDDVAQRLGLTVADGSRSTRSGDMLRWRLAGVEQAAAEPCLPFFIEWGAGTPLPGRAAAAHPAGAVRVARLELAGAPERLAWWLGAHELPVVVRRGPPAVERIVLAAGAREIVLGGAQT